MTADGPDDGPEVGYEPDVDRSADPHAPELGRDAVERTWRRLLHELTTAESVAALVETARRYGWIPPLLALVVHGVVRGVFEHLSDPFAMSQNYTFTLWELALAINVARGIFLVAFAWFMYFGVVGSFAGYISDAKAMDTVVFKVGAYFSLVFVPVFLLAMPIVLTIPAPGAAVGGTDPLSEVSAAYRTVYNTPQMQLVGVLKAVGWTIVGFLMLPVVEEAYELDKRSSVLAVLPVTIAAVVSTQLL